MRTCSDQAAGRITRAHSSSGRGAQARAISRGCHCQGESKADFNGLRAPLLSTRLPFELVFDPSIGMFPSSVPTVFPSSVPTVFPQCSHSVPTVFPSPSHSGRHARQSRDANPPCALARRLGRTACRVLGARLGRDGRGHGAWCDLSSTATRAARPRFLLTATRAIFIPSSHPPSHPPTFPTRYS